MKELPSGKVTTANKRAKSTAKIKGFFKGVLSEFKKVHWPSKKQVAVYTGVVIVAVLFLTAAIAVVDNILSFLLGLILG